MALSLSGWTRAIVESIEQLVDLGVFAIGIEQPTVGGDD